MRIENATVGYRKSAVLKDINLDVKKGEIISLIGPNGGGKSTLLKSIRGELGLVHGCVYLGEDEIKSISLSELAKKMSIVTTDRIKPELMTCKDIVSAGRLPFTDCFGFGSDKDFAAVQRAIELMKIEKIADKPFDKLSDGQKQRTLVARAISQEPEYLIMDEPTSYLDIRYRMELMEVIEKLSKEGVTVIMALHELELAMSCSDRVLLIYEDGRTLCAEPKEVLEKGLIKELFSLSDEMYEKLRLC
ncbi:MAG: ABC transporter ATP-binding protein [Butyrivibrio sp.]|nr:ABC transporter ATP-binding protein [Butyrivibrio sp.]